MPFDSAINALATRVATEFKAVYTALNGKAATLTGEIKMWPTATAPSGYLLCQGGTFSSATYPELATLLGDTYGTHSGTTYYLPDFRARSPIGVGGAAVGGGSTGNAYGLGQKYGHESLQTHAHSVYDPTHAHGVNVGWNEQQGGHNWTFGVGTSNRNVNLFTDVTSSWSPTGISIYNAGSGNSGNVHPILGINFIIKT